MYFLYNADTDLPVVGGRLAIGRLKSGADTASRPSRPCDDALETGVKGSLTARKLAGADASPVVEFVFE